MKKYLTIDFDIIMSPSIEVYNNYDGTATEYTSKFDFLGIMPADLEMYAQLTEFLKNQRGKPIIFMEDHNEIIQKTKGDGPFELINIDHHHDIGYGDNIRWKHKVVQVDEGNWVHKLWDLERITKYTWIKNYSSDDAPIQGDKLYISEKHFFHNIDLSDFNDVEKIFISHSPEWVPEYYEPLYNVWKNLFEAEEEDIAVGFTVEQQEEAEQISFDLI